MGKFAGFWKRVKNLGTNVLNGMINGMSKLNDVYKKIKPTIKPVVDAALSFVPLGGVIGWAAEKGLDKISKTIDFAKYGIDHPNTFLPSYDNSISLNEMNTNLKSQNKFTNGNVRPINVDKRRRINMNN